MTLLVLAGPSGCAAGVGLEAGTLAAAIAARPTEASRFLRLAAEARQAVGLPPLAPAKHELVQRAADEQYADRRPGCARAAEVLEVERPALVGCDDDDQADEGYDVEHLAVMATLPVVDEIGGASRGASSVFYLRARPARASELPVVDEIAAAALAGWARAEGRPLVRDRALDELARRIGADGALRADDQRALAEHPGFETLDWWVTPVDSPPSVQAFDQHGAHTDEPMLSAEPWFRTYGQFLVQDAGRLGIVRVFAGTPPPDQRPAIAVRVRQGAADQLSRHSWVRRPDLDARAQAWMDRSAASRCVAGDAGCPGRHPDDRYLWAYAEAPRLDLAVMTDAEAAKLSRPFGCGAALGGDDLVYYGCVAV